MILVIFPGLADPVSEVLWRWCSGAGVRCDRLVLSEQRLAAANLAAVRDAIQGGDAVVGVGLAGSLLLSLDDRPEPASGARLLALFPYLGVNAYAYGAGRLSATWSDRCLRLARLPWLGQAMAWVALTPAPRGLEGVLARHRLSWRHAASVLASTDFAGLLVAARGPVTVVLNLASPDLQRARAELVFSALNDRLSLAFADPADPDLPARVSQWLRGHPFNTAPEAVHA